MSYWKKGRNVGIWFVHERSGLEIMVHSGRDFGIACILQTRQHHNIADLNNEKGRIQSEFRWPGGGSVTYDVHSPRGLWSILSLDGEKVDRDIDRWPHLRMIGYEKVKKKRR